MKASKLGLGPRDSNFGLQTGIQRGGWRRRRRRRKFPICVKAKVIDPFGAAAKNGGRDIRAEGGEDVRRTENSPKCECIGQCPLWGRCPKVGKIHFTQACSLKHVHPVYKLWALFGISTILIEINSLDIHQLQGDFSLSSLSQFMRHLRWLFMAWHYQGWFKSYLWSEKTGLEGFRGQVWSLRGLIWGLSGLIWCLGWADWGLRRLT